MPERLIQQLASLESQFDVLRCDAWQQQAFGYVQAAWDFEVITYTQYCDVRAEINQW